MSNSFPSSDSIFGFAWLQLDPFNRSLSGGGQQEHQKCLAKVCLGWLTSFLSSSPSLKKTRTMTAITTPTHLHSSLFVHRLSLFFNGPECYFFVFLSGRFFFLFIALSFSSSLLHHGSVHFDSPGCGKVNPRQRDRFRYCYQPDGHFSRTRSCLSIDTDGTFPTRSNHVKCLRKKKKV